MSSDINEIKWNEKGLVPAIVQNNQSLEVLMMAWMNADSLQRTRETGEAWFWSRSRQELWHKGATSGNTQKVIQIKVDCDGDTLLLFVNPESPRGCRGPIGSEDLASRPESLQLETRLSMCSLADATFKINGATAESENTK